MSYMDEYNKLKKKRLEAEAKSSGKATSSSGSSYLNEYNKLRGQSNNTTTFDSFVRQRVALGKKDEETKAKKSKNEEKKTIDWGQYLTASDYSTLSKPTERKSKDLNLWKFWEDRGDDKYDFINNLDNYRDKVKVLSGGTGQKDMYGDYTKYSYMSEENIGIYNYLYATQGKDKAEEYLKDIEEDLNKSFGTDLYESQTAVGKAINWLPAGMENWSENVKQFFSKEERPTSPYAYQSQLIQDEAEQISPILGLAHEAGLTISNQIPNLILTKGVGTFAQAAGWGLNAINAATKATSAASIFVSSSGGAYKDALEEGKTEKEARIYSTLIGALEAGLNHAIGGIEGMTGVGTDRLLSKAATIKNSLLRNIAKHGIRITSEITEEELQLFAEPLVRMMVFDEEYDAPTIDEMVRTALVTALSTGAMNTVSDVGDGGRVNGLTVNEANVVEKVYQDEITERETDGKKLTAREKSKIYDDVVKQMERGYIDTDTIESVLGGESYESYKSLTEQETSLKEEIEALENTPENQFTVKQRERLTELREQLNGIDTKTAKSNLFSEVDKLTANDTKLRESYNEKARRGQAFEADLTKYDAKQQETIKKAVESGILNNTNRTHEFVDLVAKVSADKGVPFDFTNNQKLKESGFAIDGKQVNGYVTKDGVTVNVNSAKSLDTVVGHEITHVLEGTELYNELQTAIVEYAKSKNDYQGRYDALTKLYENIEGANIDAELTAELVGDYLFTDTDFIHNLSTNNRNVFEKIYDEVKYMLKVATAGSKEARELERVKKVFEDAYRTNSKTTNNTKYSLSDSNSKTLYTGSPVTDIQQFKVGGADGAKQTGDRYGRGVYLTTNKATAQGYAGNSGRVYEINADDLNIFNLNDSITEEMKATLRRELNGKDKQFRNSVLRNFRSEKTFTDFESAEKFFDEQRKTWKEEDGYYSANKPEIKSADNKTGEAVIEYTDFVNIDNAIGSLDGNQLYDALKSISTDDFASFITGHGFDGIAFDEDADNQQYVIYRNENRLNILPDEGIDNGQDLTYNGKRGEAYVRTDEFRNLQAESQRMPYEDTQSYWSGSRQVDDEVRGRLSRAFGLEIRSADSKRIPSVRTLLNPKTNNKVNIVEGVDGTLFHDVFEISRKYLRNGELVDLHPVETTEDTIGYNDCYNYLSEDGLSGFSITPVGDLISVFNLNAERGFLKTIAPFVKEKAKTLDCYASPQQNLMVMYEKIFGFKTASLMDYSMLFDHDDIAKNHNKPKVAYMVNTDSDVELREFTEDQYDEAVEYRNSFVNQAADSEAASFMPKNEADDIAPTKHSLSEKGATPTGKFLGKDIALETAPVAEATKAEAVEPDVAPISNTETAVETAQTEQNVPKTENVAPVEEAKVEDYAPGESLEEQLAKADDSLEILDSEIDALFRDYYAQKISDAEFEAKWRVLNERSTQATQEQKRISDEIADINNRKYESIEDSDIPPEAEAPYYDNSESVAPAEPFAERDMKDVGNRKVKAYMYENPEVKPYFQDAARGMLYDLHNGTRGERIFNEQMHYESGYEKGWMGTKRRTTSDIADLLDQWGYTYDQIEAGLNAIIEDNGKENNAASKRIEFMLDNRLRNGYKDVDGRPIPRDDGYINLLKEKAVDDYRKEGFDSFMEVADQYAPPADDIAPLKIEPAVEGEQNVLDEFEQTEQEQAPERLTRAKLHSQIVGRIKSVFTGKGIDFDKVLDDAHRMNALSINDNTPQRVNDKTFGYEAGELLNELTFNKVALDESNAIKWFNGELDTVKALSEKYKIKPRTKEAAAVQMYAEGFWVNEKNEIISYGDAELAKDFPDVQVQNRIKALASDPTIRTIYDNTLSAINESRRRNGYPEIPRLDNYFLHYRAQTDTFSQLGVPFNPNDIKAKDLPTDINGTTIDRKPGQPFFASSMHREGKRTTFDVFDGLERYLNSAKNQIYHIDNIQTARALWGYIADRYGQAHGLENLDYMEYEAQAEHIQKVYDGHLSNYARFLVEYANNLAGKTALIDRGVEGLIGRRALQFINTVNTQTGRNQIGYSISSPLTNFIPSMEAIARTSKQDSIKAFAQTVSNVFRKDGFVESDPTLIRRKGADRFSKTLWEKMSDPGYILMSTVDNVTSEFIVRTKYNELTRKGMDSKQAHIKAGEWASRVMGDRSLGQMPLLYNSKFMGLFTKYQLEVRNQLDSAFYDNIQEIKASTKDIENQTARNAKTATKIASKTLQIAVLNHVFGMAFEKIAGYNPAFDIISTIATLFGWDDDEEDEDTFGDNAEQAFKELLGDLPYTSLITDGGRIPVGSAMPIKQLITGVDKYGNEKSRLETIAEAAPYYLLPGGYSQIKKTVSGLGMFSEEHPVSGSYTDSGNLRFPVEKTFGNVLQAGLFGQYASENARDYFDNERKPLKEKQIQEYIDVDIPIKDYWEYREGLAKLPTNEAKVDYIDSLDLPLSKKNILVNNVLGRKEPVDMAEYDEYGSLEEFDFAVKYPEKYQFLEANGITVEEYSNFDDDTKEAYSWAYQNPEKYAVSKAISDDLVEYKSYTKDIYKIEADKDENGKSINGSKKEKVFAYIDNLPLDYGQKSILFKSQYKADDSMNMDIVEYLDSREDISYEEMVTILTELGFTVNGNNVYWD